eukprot:CAMPEP_0119328538 /NCGR_PEP_ID=MMETSP1333-20130426/73564_1 /TAXON_ID=418940 /ORGANISM="Scyphosphaera apsteinii, Strain RCC1455" /LENGTH=485 /DNA_ID=CAMNT_0007337419 /DNA_START=271 /DNA_END=1728 /DNA_ORIENTATION=+
MKETDWLPIVTWNASRPLGSRWRGWMVSYLHELELETGASFVLQPAQTGVPGLDLAVEPPAHLADAYIEQISDPHTMASIPGNLLMGIDWANFSGLTWTSPLLASHMSGVVHRTTEAPSMFAFLDPFTADLWLTIVATVFVTALVVALMEAMRSPPKADTMKSLRKSGALTKATYELAGLSYHMWAAALGGEDYDWIGAPAKVLRLGLLLIILVLSSTYTANLAAFFTRPNTVVHGPKSMAELRDSTVCMVFDETYPVVKQVVSYVKSIRWPEHLPTFLALARSHERKESYTDYQQEARNAWCAEEVRAGRCDIWIDNEYVFTPYLVQSGKCVDLVETTWLSVMAQHFGMMLRLDDRALANNLSSAISYINASPRLNTLLETAFLIGHKCTAVVQEASSTTPIAWENMRGLFLVFGIVVGAAFLTAAISRALKCPTFNASDSKELDHTSTEGELLRAILVKLSNDGDGAPTDTAPRARQVKADPV